MTTWTSTSMDCVYKRQVFKLITSYTQERIVFKQQCSEIIGLHSMNMFWYSLQTFPSCYLDLGIFIDCPRSFLKWALSTFVNIIRKHRHYVWSIITINKLKLIVINLILIDLTFSNLTSIFKNSFLLKCFVTLTVNILGMVIYMNWVRNRGVIVSLFCERLEELIHENWFFCTLAL